jgi:hypothetical protein
LRLTSAPQNETTDEGEGKSEVEIETENGEYVFEGEED